MDHSQLTTTRLEVVTEPPTLAPTTTQAQTKLQFYEGGVIGWLWNATSTTWEGCSWRPSRGSSPTGSITPLFVGQEHFDTGAGKLYYANGTSNSDWIEVGGTTGGGGGS